jgi:hypothetical protein
MGGVSTWEDLDEKLPTGGVSTWLDLHYKLFRGGVSTWQDLDKKLSTGGVSTWEDLDYCSITLLLTGFDTANCRLTGFRTPSNWVGDDTVTYI